jgi:hypothetical protein
MAITNDAQMPVESFTSTKTFDSQITQPKWGLMRSVNKTGIYCTEDKLRYGFFKNNL